jgi:hypothetical protein
MIERFREWMGEAFPTAILASVFVTVNWLFVLKSKGLLKTEEEWYSFGAFLMNMIPLIMGGTIVFLAVIFFVFYSIEKLCRYIRG